MDFKLFVAVFCLASIQVSEAVTVWTDSGVGTISVSECVQTLTAIGYTQTASSSGQNIASYALTSQTPASPVLFGLDTTSGALTTLTTAASTFAAATTASYAVVITATDDAPAPATSAALTLTVTVTTCCPSSASFVVPSLAVMLISLISLLMKNNN